MFRKLHIQMTLFSSLVSGAVLILMTFLCLFISENHIRQNSYAAFSSNVLTCIMNLENQTTLSHQWLLQIQDTCGIRLWLRDNGKPLYFEKLNPSPEETKAFEEAKEISKTHCALDLDLDSTQRISSQLKSEIFKMDNFYACTAIIPRSGGVLCAIILYPLKEMEHQIFIQRLSFGATALFCALAMAVFSWFFTRSLIRPLEESRRKQTEFIASASHELRSPLAVIQSGISAMDKAAPEEHTRFTHIIRQETTRMARLINDMLSLANADNHSWKLILAPCEMDTLLLDIYEKYEAAAKARGLLLRIRLPEGSLPPCTCDSSRISQVLSILMDNALSYVPAGGAIRLSLSKEEDHISLQVADNGPGIPDESKEAVFQRFYRADASRSDKAHFGLGLCIAREITELHHGTISVLDNPGGGSIFCLTLPLHSKPCPHIP